MDEVDDENEESEELLEDEEEFVMLKISVGRQGYLVGKRGGIRVNLGIMVDETKYPISEE